MELSVQTVYVFSCTIYLSKLPCNVNSFSYLQHFAHAFAELFAAVQVINSTVRLLVLFNASVPWFTQQVE